MIIHQDLPKITGSVTVPGRVQISSIAALCLKQTATFSQFLDAYLNEQKLHVRNKKDPNPVIQFIDVVLQLIIILDLDYFVLQQSSILSHQTIKNKVTVLNKCYWLHFTDGETKSEGGIISFSVP